MSRPRSSTGGARQAARQAVPPAGPARKELVIRGGCRYKRVRIDSNRWRQGWSTRCATPLSACAAGGPPDGGPGSAALLTLSSLVAVPAGKFLPSKGKPHHAFGYRETRPGIRPESFLSADRSARSAATGCRPEPVSSLPRRAWRHGRPAPSSPRLCALREKTGQAGEGGAAGRIAEGAAAKGAYRPAQRP